MLNHNKQGFHQQNWVQALAELEQQGLASVLVTVLGTDGSTPRPTGTKMLVSKTDIFDTIGGGHLEFKAIEKARSLLDNTQATNSIEHFPLGATLGQCCGGSAVVLFECFNHSKLTLDIYGAGHVAHALIHILAQLPIHIRWIDSRAELFPQSVPNNVHIVVDEDPVEQVKQARVNQAYLILTHNHQLDFDLAQAILKREDSLWLGVIGSNTKAKRFCHRLSHRGLTDEQIRHMTCPVGLSQVTGKQPMEVAVSIAGQLIELYQNQAAVQTSQTKRKQSGIQWQELLNMAARQNKTEQTQEVK